LFTKVNDQNYINISSGTIEMKDNKIIVLADQYNFKKAKQYCLAFFLLAIQLFIKSTEK
jgi:hypothetical protein